MSTLPALLAVAPDSGASGGPLRWVLLASVVGIAFLAWFLLRGYGDK